MTPRKPAMASGGIKARNRGAVRRAGATMIALVTERVGARDIPARIAALRTARAAAEKRIACGSDSTSCSQ